MSAPARRCSGRGPPTHLGGAGGPRISLRVGTGQIVTLIARTGRKSSPSGGGRPGDAGAGARALEGREVTRLPAPPRRRRGHRARAGGTRHPGRMSIEENLLLALEGRPPRPGAAEARELRRDAVPALPGAGGAAAAGGRLPLRRGSSRCWPSPAASWPAPASCSSTSRPWAWPRSSSSRSSTSWTPSTGGDHHPAGRAERAAALKVSDYAYVLERGQIVLQGPRGSWRPIRGCRRPTWAAR